MDEHAQTGKAKKRRKQATRPAALSSAAAKEGQTSSGQRTTQEQLVEAVELLDRSRRRLRILGSIGRAARAGSKATEGSTAHKVKPSLKLSEAPRSSRYQTVKTQASSGAMEAVGEQGQPQETASSSKNAAAMMRTKPVVAPVKKTVLGMTPKAKPAAAVQSTVELDDDSYEYYTSTSESQDIVQMPLQKPDSRARAEYIAGCIVLLSAWCTVVGAKRPAGLDYVQYCLVQVFPGIVWSATQRSRIVWGLRIWIQRAIKGAYKLALQRTATGTYYDELFIYLELMVAALCCILRQVRRRLGGPLHYRPDRSGYELSSPAGDILLAFRRCTRTCSVDRGA